MFCFKVPSTLPDSGGEMNLSRITPGLKTLELAWEIATMGEFKVSFLNCPIVNLPVSKNNYRAHNLSLLSSNYGPGNYSPYSVTFF